MDLDDLIECMYATNQLDDTFGLKEDCPVCGEKLESTGDSAFPYYCPDCELFISKDKKEAKNKTK